MAWSPTTKNVPGTLSSSSARSTSGRPLGVGPVVEREHDVLALRAATLHEEAGGRLVVARVGDAVAAVDLHRALARRGLGADGEHFALSEEIHRAAVLNGRQRARGGALVLAEEAPQGLVFGSEAPQGDTRHAVIRQRGRLVPGAERILAPHLVDALLRRRCSRSGHSRRRARTRARRPKRARDPWPHGRRGSRRAERSRRRPSRNNRHRWRPRGGRPSRA